VIVRDMWLTGFDAPCMHTMYADKPMRGHGLMQAIARVNRVEDGKDYGYIVDYAGVLGDLDSAMRTYSALGEFDPDDLDVGHAIVDVQAQIQKLPQAHANLLNHFKSIEKTRDEEAFEVFLSDEEVRKEFYALLGEFARLLATALGAFDWANDPKNERAIQMYKDDLRRFQKLRTAVRNRYREAIDFGQYEARIRKLLDTHISADAVEVITQPVNIFDTDAFNRAVAEQHSPASKADLIASQTKRTITERMEEDPVFFKRLSELIAQAIEDHRAKRLSDNDFLARMQDVADQARSPKNDAAPEAVQSDPHATAMFSTLENAMKDLSPGRGVDLRAVAAGAAIAMVSIVRALKVVNWTENVDVQNAMRNQMDDYFFDVVRDEQGVAIEPVKLDAIVDAVMRVARARMS